MELGLPVDKQILWKVEETWDIHLLQVEDLNHSRQLYIGVQIGLKTSTKRPTLNTHTNQDPWAIISTFMDFIGTVSSYTLISIMTQIAFFKSIILTYHIGKDQGSRTGKILGNIPTTNVPHSTQNSILLSTQPLEEQPGISLMESPENHGLINHKDPQANSMTTKANGSTVGENRAFFKLTVSTYGISHQKANNSLLNELTDDHFKSLIIIILHKFNTTKKHKGKLIYYLIVSYICNYFTNPHHINFINVDSIFITIWSLSELILVTTCQANLFSLAVQLCRYLQRRIKVSIFSLHSNLVGRLVFQVTLGLIYCSLSLNSSLYFSINQDSSYILALFIREAKLSPFLYLSFLLPVCINLTSIYFRSCQYLCFKHLAYFYLFFE